MTTYNLWVPGHPATQGSKKHVGRGRLVEMDKKLPAWRQAIQDAAANVTAHPGAEPLDGPLTVHLNVYLPAPKKSRFGPHPAGPPDLDKLQRAVGDALTIAGLITDDARIVRWVAEKHWADRTLGTGALINIYQRQDQGNAR